MQSETQNDVPVAEAEAIIQVCLAHHARRAARFFTRTFDQAFLPCGINYSQFNILVVIAALEPVPTPQIAAYMAMDRTTLSRNIKPLKQEGYVDSQIGAGRRPDIIRLTVSGHAILNKAKVLWKDAQHTLAHRIGPERAGQLLEILEHV